MLEDVVHGEKTEASKLGKRFQELTLGHYEAWLHRHWGFALQLHVLRAPELRTTYERKGNFSSVVSVPD